MRHNFIKVAARLQSSGVGTAARRGRAITSDKSVLCQLPALISLGFLDTLHTPPKSPGKRGLQAGQLAAPGVC